MVWLWCCGHGGGRLLRIVVKGGRDGGGGHSLPLSLLCHLLWGRRRSHSLLLPGFVVVALGWNKPDPSHWWLLQTVKWLASEAD